MKVSQSASDLESLILINHFNFSIPNIQLARSSAMNYLGWTIVDLMVVIQYSISSHLLRNRRLEAADQSGRL